MYMKIALKKIKTHFDNLCTLKKLVFAYLLKNILSVN